MCKRRKKKEPKKKEEISYYNLLIKMYNIRYAHIIHYNKL